MDITGREVYSKKFVINSHEAQVNFDLKAGLYIVCIFNKNGKTKNQKLIIKD